MYKIITYCLHIYSPTQLNIQNKLLTFTVHYHWQSNAQKKSFYGYHLTPYFVSRGIISLLYVVFAVFDIGLFDKVELKTLVNSKLSRLLVGDDRNATGAGIRRKNIDTLNQLAKRWTKQTCRVIYTYFLCIVFFQLVFSSCEIDLLLSRHLPLIIILILYSVI